MWAEDGKGVLKLQFSNFNTYANLLRTLLKSYPDFDSHKLSNEADAVVQRPHYK